MKIAVMSDVHGNMEALEAVIKDIEEEEECKQIFVLGDYAVAGPEPDVAIDFFFDKQLDSKYKMIQGNTDYMLANYAQSVYDTLKEQAPVMAEALKNDYFMINPIQRNFLKDLPPQMELEIEGVKILLVHGSPRKNNEDILPDTKMSEVEEMLEGTTANLILCGHTHIPCGFQTSKKQTVVNVGSIGRPFTKNAQACYLKLTIEEGKCLFEHKFIPYNKERAALKLSKRTFVGANKLANVLLDPQVRHF